MPVTFAPGSHPSSGRRPSASSPFPGRVVPSLRPSDPPPPRKKRGSRGSLSAQGQAGTSPTASSRVPEDPFEGCPPPELTEEGLECSGSPQDAFVPLRPERVDEDGRRRDPERQPLLADADVDEPPQLAAWGITLLIAFAIAIITFLILGVWHLADGDGEDGARVGRVWRG